MDDYDLLLPLTSSSRKHSGLFQYGYIIPRFIEVLYLEKFLLFKFYIQMTIYQPSFAKIGSDGRVVHLRVSCAVAGGCYNRVTFQLRNEATYGCCLE